jgi:hypothetical protein
MANEKDEKIKSGGAGEAAGAISDAEEQARVAAEEAEKARRSSEDAAAADEARRKGAESGEAGGITDEDDESQDLVGQDHLSPEEREALRERRREERRHRKELQRQRMAQKDRELEALRRANEELVQRVAAVERRGVSSDMAQIDSGIAEANRVAAAAREEMKTALAAQDGEAMTRAQEAWYAAQRRAENLASLKQRVIRAEQVNRAGASAQRQPATDRVVVRNAENWASSNPWYDPELKDPDSRVARSLDEGLHEEGWDPRTPEYWDEFNARVAKYLPHRMKRGTVAGSMDRQAQAGGGTQGNGGSRTGGSARDTSGGGARAFTLSPERIQAIKDAGMWEDKAKRDRMIQRFKDFDKAQKGA